MRLWGVFTLTRCLGNFEFKRMKYGIPENGTKALSPIPEIVAIQRNPEDDFLILASDGIWDVITNEEACEFISKELQETDDLNVIAAKVIEHCRKKVYY